MEYEFEELIRPIPEGRDWWESLKQFPMKIIDQSFGYELQKTDMQNPDKIPDSAPWPRTKLRQDDSGYSSVKLLDDSFQVELCTSPFKDTEVDARIEKGFLVIHGEHADLAEGDGTTRRSFTRRYMLPHDCDEFVIDSKNITKSNCSVIVKLKRKTKTTQNKMDIDE
ncbi:hypothetical protein JTE90_011828 [Oedothorax gibbosus]|uniref:SHSP domain-containing protein n=1 Tax=Oedothorax gibbosus TaxID=931172 RepID=A0AAV6VU93_9ARAC|nr:hypothetical protein JTE90_011828 [Oedothorax gibbosus]